MDRMFDKLTGRDRDRDTATSADDPALRGDVDTSRDRDIDVDARSSRGATGDAQVVPSSYGAPGGMTDTGLGEGSPSNLDASQFDTVSSDRQAYGADQRSSTLDSTARGPAMRNAASTEGENYGHGGRDAEMGERITPREPQVGYGETAGYGETTRRMGAGGDLSDRDTDADANDNGILGHEYRKAEEPSPGDNGILGHEYRGDRR